MSNEYYKGFYIREMRFEGKIVWYEGAEKDGVWKCNARTKEELKTHIDLFRTVIRSPKRKI